jgi:DNA repair protein RadD
MLREYQGRLLANIRVKAQAKVPVCAVSATGSGKSHLLAAICEGAASKGNNALVLAHRKELIKQNQSKLGYGAIYCAGLDSKQIDQITFGSIASVFAAKEKFQGTKIILVDECHRLHHRAIGMYRELIDYLKPDIVIGFTATPYRLIKGENVSIVGENHFFKVSAIGDSVSKLIADGYLCRLTSKVAREQANLAGVEKDAQGDFKESDVEKRMQQLSGAVKEIAEVLQTRKRVIIFTSGIAHAEDVEFQLMKLGIRAHAVTSNTGELFRDSFIQEFLNGECQVLIGAQIFTEGFDCPSIDCVVILRATQSLALFHQIVGRGLRIAEGKENCLIMDFGHNFERHGLLEEFDVKAEVKPDGKVGFPPVKICPSCQHLQPLSIRVCKECFFEFPFVAPESKLGKNFYEGELFEGEIEAEFYAVEKIVYQPHKAKSGRDCMKVQYTTKVSNKRFYEWVSMPDIQACFEGNSSELFLAKKLAEWLEKRGLPQERTDTIDNIEDLLLSAHEYQHPVDISIVPDTKNPKYNRVEVLQTGEVQFEVHTEAPKLTSDSTFWK